MSKRKNGSTLSRRAFVKHLGGAAVIAAQSARLPLSLAGSGETQPIKVGPLSIEPRSGRLVNINNSFAATQYPLDGWRFVIQLEGLALNSETAQKVNVERGTDTVRIFYDYSDHEVIHSVQSGPVVGFAESVLKVRHKAARSL